jgi:SulP family sulfate permease
MAKRQEPPPGPKTTTHRAWSLLDSFASYRAAFIGADLVSGLTLAAIAIPEQMATARLGGFSPQFGFYAFVAGSIAFALLGGSRVLSSGADSTITPIFAGTLVAMAAAGSPDHGALASALALMVGIIVVAAGLFRFGWIANLLSVPVTLGFLAGIAAHIFISQLPAVLGLEAPGGPLLVRVAVLAEHLGETNPFTILLGISVLAVIVASELIDVRIPGALIGLVAATLAVILMGLEGRGVAVLGSISGISPAPTIPQPPVAQLTALAPLACIIAMIVMMQTAATTRAFPSDPDEPPDVNRDFIGVGAGSILSGLAGSFPVNASPPRTAIVAQTGGRSQLAGIVGAAIVLVLLGAGATLLSHVPQAALAAVLFFVAFRIVRIRQIAAVLRTSSGEFMLFVATAAGIVVLPIEHGVGVGIALSLLHGIWSMTRARIIIFERVPRSSVWWPKSQEIKGEREAGVLVVGFPAPLSFLNAYDFRSGFQDALRSEQNVTLVVLEATGIVEIDFTAAQVLTGVIRKCHDDHIDFAIARLESARAERAMARFGIDQVLGQNRLFRSVEEAVQALKGGTRVDGTHAASR